MTKRKWTTLLAIDIAASVLLGVSIDVFTVKANFAPGGVSGLAVILNYLFSLPVGLVTILINIPIVLATFKRLGLHFFFSSVKSVIINAVFIDFVIIHLPPYAGSRLFSAVMAGVFAGMAYSLLFNVGSSTGGTDFIIAAVQRAKPALSFGMLAFVIDGVVIVLSVFIFGEIGSFVYGMVYALVTSLSLDATTAALRRTGLIG